MSPTQRGSQIAAVRFWFGIDRGTASLLVELFRAGGIPLSRHRLAALCDLSIVSVKTRISELRVAMDSEAVDTRSGCYALTEVGMAECREAFAAMAADLHAILDPVFAPQTVREELVGDAL